MSRKPKRREVTVGGLRISLLEWGEAVAHAPTLVMLHGLMAEGVTFGELIAGLPPDRHTVAFDLPGAGFSERPPLSEEVSFAGLASVLQQAIGQLGIHRPVLLGHSHGGVLALRMAASRPDLLRGLILLCPAHPFSATERWLVQFYLSAPGRLFAHALAHLPRPAFLFGFKRMPGSWKSISYGDIEPYIHTLRTPGTVRHLLRLLQSWNADMAALAEDLRTRPIELPALLLWGERDAMVPISTAPALLEHLPNARLVPLPHVGHVPTIEAPIDCARNIVAWLQKLQAAEDVRSDLGLQPEAGGDPGPQNRAHDR